MSFFNDTLGITILNNWNIGTGVWDASAGAGSAQKVAADAGLAATGLSGWVLPTGDVDANPAVIALNQYQSIWDQAGGTFAALQAQFDGVQPGYYWSASGSPPSEAYLFGTGGDQFTSTQNDASFAVAVRAGDVAASVPEPTSLALLSRSLGALGLVSRRRSV